MSRPPGWLQLIDSTQFGKYPAPQYHDQDCSHPARHYRWHRPQPRRQTPPRGFSPPPPATTAGPVPSHAAVTPDSNCPTSFDAPMNIMLTALTRPRISSGVEICTRVCRTTTLTMSQAPSITSAATLNPTFRDSPNTTVHAPNPATHHSMIAPACRLNGRCASTIAMITAPVPGAPRRIPNPVAPTPRMSFANTGISATAPPSSTANMSSEIAPSVIFARHK